MRTLIRGGGAVVKRLRGFNVANQGIAELQLNWPHSGVG